MPYSYPKNVPTWSKNLPTGAQKIAVKVFNAVLKENGSEDTARKAAWSNIKQKYKKVGDKWVKKNLSVNLDEMITSDNIPDDVLELPGSMTEVWSTLFNGLVKKDISIPVARDTAWKMVKKYIFQDSDGGWKMKKLDHPEKILSSVAIGKRRAPIEVFKSNGENGLFKMTIPLDTKASERDGRKFLKGIASANKLDREDDIMMPQFIAKMKRFAKNLPVFLDHMRDSDHLIGHVADVPDTDDEVFFSETELEKEWSEDNPDGNVQVTKLLKRMEKIDFGYSVGGKITKAIKKWRADLGKFVREIYDGELYELSVVPVPALEGTNVQLTIKNFGDKFFEKADADTLDNFSEEFGISSLKSLDVPVITSDNLDSHTFNEEESAFWMNFVKSVEKYAKLSAEQPEWDSIDEESLPDSCFIKTGNFIKDSRSYPYKYVPDGSDVPEIHLEALDISYELAMENKDEYAIKVLDGVRKALGVGEREYNYIDFRKLLIGTISDALEAKNARWRLQDVISEYYNIVDNIVWSETDVEQKSADLTQLTNQLIEELKILTDKMSKEVIFTVKKLSI